MGYLIDTNVLSEMRKGKRGHPRLIAWSTHVPRREMFLSVMVLGEVRCGIESVRGRDPAQAAALEEWLGRTNQTFADTILPVTREIADRWGRLSATGPLGEVDGLLAATALVHGHIVVTRNIRDFTRTGVALLNPFEDPSSKT
jgi:predicted nucleic acid-binding protein